MKDLVNLQKCVVGDMLSGDHNFALLRASVRRSALKAEHFTDPAMRTAFGLFMAMDPFDHAKFCDEAAAKIGPEACEEAIKLSSSDPLFDARIAELAARGRYNAFMAQVDALKLRFEKGELSPSAVMTSIASECEAAVRQAPQAADKGRSLADYGDPVPEEENPDGLFAGGWLRKGLGGMVVSVAGAGKSVMSIQMAYAWARGRPAFGIAPVRPLRIALLQSEDDDADMAEFRDGVKRGYREVFGWTDEDFRLAEENIRTFDADYAFGPRLADRMREVQTCVKRPFDLFIVNPFYTFSGGKVIDNDEMRKFLVDGPSSMDSVIKDGRTKCGLLFIHHTNKPPSAQNRVGYGTDQYAEYIGAGAATITNWTRAVLALVPTSAQGEYKLVAAKRGDRLGWERRSEKDVHPTRIIRHSTREEGTLFWREASSPAPEAVASPADTTAEDAAKLAKAIADHPRPMTKMEIRRLARDELGRKRGDAAYAVIKGNWSGFGLKEVPGPRAAEKYVCASDK